MVMQFPRQVSRPRARNPASPAAAVRAAVAGGLTIGRQVKLGIVRGVVIGYNIACRGRFPGRRYPLLVKTELGITKCHVDEVVPV